MYAHTLFSRVGIGILVFSFLLPYFAFAQDTSTRRERAEERIETVRENVASRTEAVRENIGERREGLRQAALDRIQNLLGNIVRRMHAAVGRLENIAERLLSRAEKLASTFGVDVENAQAMVENARSELALARTLLEDLVESTGGTLAETDPRAQFLRVRGTLGEVGNHIKTAHQMLREAIGALKAALGEIDEASGVSDAVRNDVASTTEEVIE